MQNTGIIRRVDELGRIVVPKEIRRMLRIKEGDPVEIYNEKDQVVVKKYSPVASLEDYCSYVAEGIEKIAERSCIITDTDKVVYVGEKKKSLYGEPISDKLTDILRSGKSVLVSCGDGGEPVSITKNDDGAENQIIVPIVVDGDCFGSIIAYDNDKTKRFNSSDVKFVRMCAFVLSKQFDV